MDTNSTSIISVFQRSQDPRCPSDTYKRKKEKKGLLRSQLIIIREKMCESDPGGCSVCTVWTVTAWSQSHTSFHHSWRIQTKCGKNRSADWCVARVGLNRASNMALGITLAARAKDYISNKHTHKKKHSGCVILRREMWFLKRRAFVKCRCVFQKYCCAFWNVVLFFEIPFCFVKCRYFAQIPWRFVTLNHRKLKCQWKTIQQRRWSPSRWFLKLWWKLLFICITEFVGNIV